MKKVIIRCRKCWEDVIEQSAHAEVPPKCPLCRKLGTLYVHAVIKKTRGPVDREDQEAVDGTSGPG